MKRYFAPVLPRTGALHAQPHTAIRAGYTLDQLLNWLPVESLDAPDIVPSGSVRTMEIGQIVLGVSHIHREAAR